MGEGFLIECSEPKDGVDMDSVYDFGGGVLDGDVYERGGGLPLSPDVDEDDSRFVNLFTRPVSLSTGRLSSNTVTFEVACPNRWQLESTQKHAVQLFKAWFGKVEVV